MEPSALFRNSATSRNELFNKLKPCCVEISKLAMGQSDQPASSARLLQLTDQLCDILSKQIEHDASALDPKIADYVFFPLSYIFREREKYAARVVENCVRCIGMLVQHGWRSNISPILARQLLSMLTFMIDGALGKEPGHPPPEETILECYRSLATLIRAACLSASVSASLVDSTGLPSLGHTVTVILDGTTDGATVDIELAALDALRALFVTMKDRAALASFFPGTVSSLSKLLSPPSSLKAQKRVLVRGLAVLKEVLVRLLGDILNRDALRKLEASEESKSGAAEALSPSWLRATSSQVKLALAMVLKLRSHGSADVRRAVERLCLSLLDECHTSLAACAMFLVETAIITGEEDDESTRLGFGGAVERISPSLAQGSVPPDAREIGTRLQDLAMIYPELQDTVKVVVYNWTTSLPRVLQGADEIIKQQTIRSLAKGYRLTQAMQIDSSTLHDTLSTTLRDSVVALTASNHHKDIMSEVDVVEDSASGLAALATQSTQPLTLRPVMLSHGSQRATREAMVELMHNIGPPSQQTQLAARMLDSVRDSDGLDQITAYWLAFELLKAAFSKSSDLDAFVDFSLSDSTEGPDEVFHELYSFSVSVLVSHSDSSMVDWRLEATALEVTSFAASRSGISFRPELIDVLYPTATFLGSQVPQLRARAVATLNTLASSCGYQDVSELIIDNADYMVNSVSLSLNTFDITPASTQVLKMMIRLTGPRLLPFLDDVVAAIFAALDNYHGYPAFVERLFGVLSEVVDQGIKSDRLLLESKDASAPDHRKRPGKARTVSEIELNVLDRRAKRRRMMEQDKDVEEVVTGHPREPWKSEAAELLRRREQEMEGGVDADGNSEASGSGEVEKTKPPPTPTYALLSRVATLTQHYLTSPAPTLRKSLLDLLATASPAMAADEDAFLPLVNSLWPVVIARLHDAEPYVVAAACRAVAAIARGAGDFLSSRIKVVWWDSLGDRCLGAKNDAATAARGTAARGNSGSSNKDFVGGSKGGVSYLNLGTTGDIVLPHRAVTAKAGGRTGGAASSKPAGATSGGLGRFAQAALVWEAAIEMLVALVSHVRLEDDIFDQMLELLGDELVKHADVRGALETVNPDAVWLAMYERGAAGPNGFIGTPAMDGVDFAQADSVLQPVGG